MFLGIKKKYWGKGMCPTPLPPPPHKIRLCFHTVSDRWRQPSHCVDKCPPSAIERLVALSTCLPLLRCNTILSIGFMTCPITLTFRDKPLLPIDMQCEHHTSKKNKFFFRAFLSTQRCSQTLNPCVSRRSAFWYTVTESREVWLPT